VSIFSNRHFPGEVAVDVDEITSGEDDAEEPPNQAYFQPIVRGFRARDGKRVNGIAGGQHHGVKPEDDTSEHAGQIRTGCKKGFALVTLDDLELDAGESRNCKERENKAPRIRGEIFPYLWLNFEGNCGNQRS